MGLSGFLRLGHSHCSFQRRVTSVGYCAKTELPPHLGLSQLSTKVGPPAPRSSIRMAAAKQLSYEDTAIGADLADGYDKDLSKPSRNRRAGIILHPTSLPGPYGTGEIGEEAFRFVDWLASAGMQIWQVLPLVPPETMAWSPYSGLDALCGNVLLISLDKLVEEGLLSKSDLPANVPLGNCAFPEVEKVRTPILVKAADKLLAGGKFDGLLKEMKQFAKDNAWCQDSALFHALAYHNEETKHKAWWTWDGPIRKHDAKAVKEARGKFATEIQRFVALQFLFDRQWKAVKAYANDKAIKIVGDMPIYVGGQSADVWAYQDLFELSSSGAPATVSGVPPDAFSETGQLWGSPLYDWPAHKKTNFKWWAQRLSRAFQLYDETRIDHFRGFAGYWAVDAKAETAINGSWRKGPGQALFAALEKELGHVPIIAEDLGVITKDVDDLRKGIGAPGMVVLQFAWGGGPTNIHLPHNHYENSICYPGTHDNETMVGWYKDSADARDKAFLKAYLGSDGSDIAWDMIRESMKSVSMSAIFLLQDVMRLDNKARMNFPGTIEGNWAWRVGDSGVWAKLKAEAKALRALASSFDRLAPGVQPEEPEEQDKALTNGSSGKKSHSSNGSSPVKAVQGAVAEISQKIEV
ncbi:hypothetical protein WJX73_001909 [Symbiochloris irregularis]|uniref:4-alpha-glucanotransferase n=1 Tax=Symbiochloris irregularis TaxID=706552 RepID=A0AAW1NPR1_9CHLO